MKAAVAAVAMALVLYPGTCRGDGDGTQMEWYGYFKLDMARDSAASSHGNYALYVRPHTAQGVSPSFSITARQSRVGFWARRGAAKGRLEADFYGASPENKNTLLLRYAYVELPLGWVTLEAGQAADLVGPLAPATVNYSVLWGSGNIGYRRPQLKMYGQAGRYWFGISLARNISGDLDGDTLVDGEASGVPAVQCRAAYQTAAWAVGVSGHYGRCSCPSQGVTYSNWSLVGDLRLGGGAWTLEGELFTGANLGQYGAAVFNSDRYRKPGVLVDGSGGLESRGGWAALRWRVAEAWRIGCGGGGEWVERRLLQGVEDARAGNTSFFVNGAYRLEDGVELALELSHWRTRYINRSPGHLRQPTDWRLQGAVKADF